jgi:hypothetical protein
MTRTDWRPSVKGLSNLRGPFGVLDSNRIDVKREQVSGHLLDRQMLELILRWMKTFSPTRA